MRSGKVYAGDGAQRAGVDYDRRAMVYMTAVAVMIVMTVAMPTLSDLGFATAVRRACTVGAILPRRL